MIYETELFGNLGGITRIITTRKAKANLDN